MSLVSVVIICILFAIFVGNIISIDAGSVGVVIIVANYVDLAHSIINGNIVVGPQQTFFEFLHELFEEQGVGILGQHCQLELVDATQLDSMEAGNQQSLVIKLLISCVQSLGSRLLQVTLLLATHHLFQNRISDW